MKQYAPALKHIADIIERGIREHPGVVASFVDKYFLSPQHFLNML